MRKIRYSNAHLPVQQVLISQHAVWTKGGWCLRLGSESNTSVSRFRVGRRNLEFDHHKLPKIAFGVIAQCGQNISQYRQPSAHGASRGTMHALRSPLRMPNGRFRLTPGALINADRMGGNIHAPGLVAETNCARKQSWRKARGSWLSESRRRPCRSKRQGSMDTPASPEGNLTKLLGSVLRIRQTDPGRQSRVSELCSD